MASSNQEVQLNFRSGGFSVSHVLFRVSISSTHRARISHPNPQHFAASDTSKVSPSDLATARLFCSLDLSPNTCASYVQGQNHSPSVTGCAISQSPTTRDLTISQTFSKCPDDYTHHNVRAAACFQFHDPRVKVRRAASLSISSPLTPIFSPLLARTRRFPLPQQ